MIQQLCLQNPAIRQKWGLSNQAVNKAIEQERSVSGSALPDAPKKRGLVSVFDLTPLQLVDVSGNHHQSFRASLIPYYMTELHSSSLLLKITKI